MKKLPFIALFLLAGPAMAGPVTKGDVQRLSLDQLTLNGSVITSAEFGAVDGVTAGTVTASKALVVDASRDISSVRNLGSNGTITDTRAPTADSATTNNGISVVFTVPIDTTGTNTHNAFNVTPTISNATAGTNTFNGYNFANVTGDAQVDVSAVRIGTGTTLGTSYAIRVGSGWDAGLASASPGVNTYAAGADSAATNIAQSYALAFPADTTGTNTHEAIDIAITSANSTGGTNTVTGINFPNYTGDTSTNINAIKIGTSDGLGTANALTIGSGWDLGITTASKVLSNYAAGADSGTTNKSQAFTFTYPVDTTGTNTHTLIDMALTGANATGGTNTVNGLNFANYTGDAQVNVNAINIGTSDGLGTANAITDGSGWDLGIVTDSGVKINSTSGTTVTALRFASDAVANGQTSKTTTLTGVTASSKCVATVNTVPTNSVFLKSAAPGTDQVVVTASADPGASTLAYTVICLN